MEKGYYNAAPTFNLFEPEILKNALIVEPREKHFLCHLRLRLLTYSSQAVGQDLVSFNIALIPITVNIAAKTATRN